MDIPAVTIQFLGPNIVNDSVHGFWFKIKSNPAPTVDLPVILRIFTVQGDILNNGLVVIPENESSSANFFYNSSEMGIIDTFLEIAPCALFAELSLPGITHEGYILMEDCEAPQYELGYLSRIKLPQTGTSPGHWLPLRRVERSV